MHKLPDLSRKKRPQGFAMNIGRVEIASRDRERYIFLWSSPSRCSLVALTWWACSRRIRDVHSAMFIPRWCFQPCGNNPLRCVCGPPRHCVFVIVESDDIQGISVVTLTQWGPPEFGAPDDQCLGQYLRVSAKAMLPRFIPPDRTKPR